MVIPDNHGHLCKRALGKQPQRFIRNQIPVNDRNPVPSQRLRRRRPRKRAGQARRLCRVGVPAPQAGHLLPRFPRGGAVARASEVCDQALVLPLDLRRPRLLRYEDGFHDAAREERRRLGVRGYQVQRHGAGAGRAAVYDHVLRITAKLHAHDIVSKVMRIRD